MRAGLHTYFYLKEPYGYRSGFWVGSSRLPHSICSDWSGKIFYLIPFCLWFSNTIKPYFMDTGNFVIYAFNNSVYVFTMSAFL